MEETRREYLVLVALITVVKIGIIVVACVIHTDDHEVVHAMHRVCDKKVAYYVDKPIR